MQFIFKLLAILYRFFTSLELLQLLNQSNWHPKNGNQPKNVCFFLMHLFSPKKKKELKKKENLPSCFHSEVLNENEVKCQYFCTFITTNYDIRSWYYNSKTQEQEFFMRYLSIQQHFSWTTTIPSPSS